LAFHSGREADHSPPSSAESKNGWSCTSTPPIRLHGVALKGSTGAILPLPFLVTRNDAVICSRIFYDLHSHFYTTFPVQT
jgi:hypothetical protein